MVKSGARSYFRKNGQSNPFKVGDRVATLGYTGTVRYVGPTNIEEGEWCGIECDKELKSGNDGTHQFKRLVIIQLLLLSVDSCLTCSMCY